MNNNKRIKKNHVTNIKKNKKPLIVIGAGASGILAAIAASFNQDVILIEKNNRIGKKILVTGNGRCNISNVNTNVRNFISFGENEKIIENVLNMFSVEETIRFFSDLGIFIKEEENGKLFPNSNEASSVVDLFLLELKRREDKIKIITNAKVLNVKKENKEFLVETALSLEDETLKDNKTSKIVNKIFKSDKLVLALGGNSMKNLGTSGDGFHIAKNLGHKVTSINPALVPLKLKGNFFKKVDGVKIKTTGSLIINGKQVYEEYGDILFTKYGISGPPILNMSLLLDDKTIKNKKTEICVNILNMDENKAKSILMDRFYKHSEREISDSLIGLISKRLIVPILKLLNIDIHKNVKNLSKKEIDELSKILTNISFQVEDFNGFENSRVTKGGVKLDEVNPYTLESKKVKGLYFAGEILDIAGFCGGFNLQFAFSSGYLAGINASKN